MTTNLLSEFKRRKPTYDQLMEEVRYVLERAIQAEGVKVHAILSRVKDSESFLQKISRLNTDLPFEEVTDIVGVRVICLFRSDIPRIGQIIRSALEVKSEDNKIEGQEISSFGYQSVHFIATLKADYSGPRYDSIKNLAVEVQVRTVAMDAWATVSHYLDYKASHDVPRHLRKDFYALSGLFYVVDTHFELFFQAGERNKAEVADKISAQGIDPDEELNIDTLRAYLARKITERHVPESDAEGYSELMSELSGSGYKQVGQLDQAIDIGWEAFLAYEKENPPMSKKGRKFNAIGVVRGLLSILDPNYYESREHKSKLDEYEKYRGLLRE